MTFTTRPRYPLTALKLEIHLNLLVTGAAGFIGSAFVREAVQNKHFVVVLDALTYAGHEENIQELIASGQIELNVNKIQNYENNLALLNNYKIDAIVNFAAESHVDNSITGPKAFIETNIMGTFELLEAARTYLRNKPSDFSKNFRFVHVSTDEVYGTLGDTGKFNEELPYQPNSPYSASKAASDHLVRAWHHTFGIPTVTTNCSNNYGPRQFPEKLIPVMITKCLQQQPLPVYGTGGNIRDWIHVEDHAHGVYLALTKGTPGETYCFGGNSERTNLQVVESLCKIMDKCVPLNNQKSYSELISFVQDRAGHDWRYAIDDSKAQAKLGFKRKYTSFEEGLENTIKWYLENTKWISAVTSKKNKKGSL